MAHQTTASPIGGDFNSVGSHTRNHVARLSLPTAALQTLDVEGDTVTWRRSGSAPELHSVPILSYSTGGPFMPLGPLTRVAGGWQRTGVPVPMVPFYYLRAEGRVGGAQNNYGSGPIHSVRQVFNHESVFVNGFE